MPAPKPDFPKRSLTTIFLRVAPTDWAAITQGLKTEYRATGQFVPYGLRPGVSQLPLPVSGYSVQPMGPPRKALLVVEEAWTEPLISISDASLRREGFASLKEFRLYWRKRTGRFPPLMEVVAMRLRPADRSEAEAMLFDRLYGFLDDTA